ncbi:MAG: hypothetical protein WD078_11460, partial [Woeseia sp.]
MSRQSISFTDPNTEWLKHKVDVEGEYKSNSEAVNDLIRKAREMEFVRARLIHAEQSGFTAMTADEILAAYSTDTCHSFHVKLATQT